MTRLLPFILLLLGALPVRSHELFSPISLNVRVHLMQSVANPRLQTTLTAKEVRAIFDEVNVIWTPAAIRFEVQAIETLQAMEIAPKRWYIRDRNWVKEAIPTQQFSPTAIDVCFVRDMGPNGFFYGEPVVVCQNPEFHKVSGGAANIVARVTAHELGHVLLLQHRQEITNLMASGKNGVALNQQEIRDARKQALKLSAKP